MATTKLPGLYLIAINRSKLTAYLLNPLHPDGWSKAKYYKEAGITAAEDLEAILLRLVHENDVTGITASDLGTKYLMEGTVMMPSGKTIRL